MNFGNNFYIVKINNVTTIAKKINDNTWTLSGNEKIFKKDEIEVIKFIDINAFIENDLLFTKEKLIDLVKYSNKFTDNSSIDKHIDMWLKWENLKF